MGVSKNSGTPKSSILIGFSIIFTIHFGGPPLFFETPTNWPWFSSSTSSHLPSTPHHHSPPPCLTTPVTGSASVLPYEVLLLGPSHTQGILYKNQWFCRCSLQNPTKIFLRFFYMFCRGKHITNTKLYVPTKMVLLSSCKNILQQKICNKRSSSPRSCPTRQSENGADLHRAHLNNFMPEMDIENDDSDSMSQESSKRKFERHQEPLNSGKPTTTLSGPIIFTKNLLAEIHFHSAVWEQKVPFAPSLPSPRLKC